MEKLGLPCENLPDDVVNIIVQDPVNPSILYTGLDHGSYLHLMAGLIGIVVIQTKCCFL